MCATPVLKLHGRCIKFVLKGPAALELLEFLNARDMVKSVHDSYVHDVGINREVAYLPLCFFVEAKKLSSTLMNKNISGVVVRGIVLRIN